MNTLTFTGAAGVILWGYHPAASVTSWSFTPDQAGGGRLTATVLQMDAFRVAQQPLTFAVPRPTGPPWKWAVQSLQIAGASLTASVVPQES